MMMPSTGPPAEAMLHQPTTLALAGPVYCSAMIAIPAGPVADPKMALIVRKAISEPADHDRAERPPKIIEPMSATRNARRRPYMSANFPELTARTAKPRFGPTTTQTIVEVVVSNSVANVPMTAARTDTMKVAEMSPNRAVANTTRG